MGGEEAAQVSQQLCALSAGAMGSPCCWGMPGVSPGWGRVASERAVGCKKQTLL